MGRTFLELVFSPPLPINTHASPSSTTLLTPSQKKVNVPTSWGYHRIPNPRQYGLPPSQPVENSTEGEEIFLATFGHQLHCLVSEGEKKPPAKRPMRALLSPNSEKKKFRPLTFARTGRIAGSAAVGQRPTVGVSHIPLSGEA